MLLLLKIVFSGLALWWCLHQVDFNHLSQVFKEFPIMTYIYALVVMSLCVSLNGLRLYYIAQKTNLKTSLKFLHNLTWVGTFFNQLLPSGIGGDAYRIYALSKRNSLLSSTATIMWDRVLGMSSMGIICIPMLFFIHIPSSLRISTFAIYGFLLLGMIFLALFIKFPILQRYKIIRKLWEALSYGKNFITRPFGTLEITSVLSAFVNFFAFYLLVHALKIPLNFLESSVLYTISLLVVLIPLSISGWGLRESFLTAYLIECGLPPEKGLTLGILQGLLMLAAGCIGAVFYLFSKNQKNSLGTDAQNR
ncbi:MAG: lysylphosphatidylglycerol synthase transmembrane domain-containing protein [Pseudomonadota bacterium]|jgi:uncharacterized membrane protein YbhN (UPF0104 family)|nr:flippase-like domain-containing protein [Alphaproteobacteria bacterium]